ncbi:vWA domain-containing protein [Lichenifustis flavocetrariae]|uniref:VWA domain-containing protein n=1 Tax=Lichenifustis flavocetrariae TaxID=2949735 RepID=A0AA41YY84_9HYPH|nr:VWA domain-containing protein [Lichenifustis flavocetrariae]MCW6510776.1 VWA domain-containing protein [Lichenifustis flavocetrariae]
MHFARALRAAGLAIGPGAVQDALTALQLAGFEHRDDVRAALHATLVRRHDQTILFDQAFDAFWRRRGYLDKLMAALSPLAQPEAGKQKKPDPGASRVSEALARSRRDERPAPPPELSARLTVSAQEKLARKDFAQMTAAEIAEAIRLVAQLRLPRDAVKVRRHTADARGSRVDPRRAFRRSMRAGGAGIELAYRSPEEKRPPIVAICDISGSMADYTRIFLHFLHAMTAERRNVHSFLFGTRLTNVTRALRAKDADEALTACGAGVLDWAGGTRIGPSLHRFNKDWSRRVLGQGATVILFTDGLEREGLAELAQEMERLHRSCRRLIWVNPLLRFAAFEAKAGGIRTMLAHVDDFRPIHDLRSMRDLCTALGNGAGRGANPRRWLRIAEAERPIHPGQRPLQARSSAGDFTGSNRMLSAGAVTSPQS